MWKMLTKKRTLYSGEDALAGAEYSGEEISDILKQVKSPKCFIDICLQETWSGKKFVWKIIKKTDLNEAIIDIARYDYQEFTIEYDDFVIYDFHHDGTNRHVIRKLTKSFDEIEMKMEDIEALANAAEEGKFIDSVTEKLGPTVEDVAMAWEG